MRQNMRSIVVSVPVQESEKQYFHFRFALGEIIGERAPWPTNAETVVEGLARPIDRRSSQHMTGVFPAVESGFTP